MDDDIQLIGPASTHHGYYMPDGTILFAENAAEQCTAAWIAEVVNKLNSIDQKLDRLLSDDQEKAS